MDAQRFDALTKALAARATRRRLFGGLLGGAATSLLARLRLAAVRAQESPPIQPAAGVTTAEPTATVTPGPKTTRAPYKANCWNTKGKIQGPDQIPTPFLYQPFRFSEPAKNRSITETFAYKWSAQMDHTRPTYERDGTMGTLGERLAYNDPPPDDPTTAYTGGTKAYFAATDSYAYFDSTVSPDKTGSTILAYESAAFGEMTGLGDGFLFYDGHDGNDFAVGGEALAAAAGEVVFAGDSGSPLGRIVDIVHPEGYLTRYAHLAKTLVEVADKITKPGKPVGIIGGSANWGKGLVDPPAKGSWGVHLHFGVFRWNEQRGEWQVTDPFGWDPWRSPGEQDDDPLVACNGEVSHNLWFGWWPRPYDAQSDALASVGPPVEGRYLGGSLAEWGTPSISAGPEVDELTETGAVVAWTTDLPSVGTVEYGLTRELGRQRPRKPAKPATDHRVALDKLDPGRTYFYRVRSTGDGGEVVTDLQTFSTPGGCVDAGSACHSDSDCCAPADICLDGVCRPSQCLPGGSLADRPPCGPGPGAAICGCMTTPAGRGVCIAVPGTGKQVRCDYHTPCTTAADCGPGGACVAMEGCFADGTGGCWYACGEDGSLPAELPAFMIGEWSGSGQQDDPPMTWPIVMTFSAGGVGSVVGTVAYPTLGCQGGLTLTGVATPNPAAGWRIGLHETITDGLGTCVDGGAFDLRFSDESSGWFSWRAPDGSSTATGTLSPGEAVGNVVVWVMACPGVTETRIDVLTQGNADPGPTCRGLGEEVSISIYDDGGNFVAAAYGGTVFTLPLGSYTVVEDATGVSAPLELQADGTPYGSCSDAADCVLVIVSVPYETGRSACDGEGLACGSDSDCCQGEFCLYLGYCTRICTSDSDCAGGLVCCTNRNPAWCNDTC